MTENNDLNMNENLTEEIDVFSEDINTDDDLGRLIYDNMSQTFGNNDISVSEDLIAKTMARINALPKTTGTENAPETAEGTENTSGTAAVVDIAAERAKKRNRIIKIAATAAAGLVIGIVGIKLITSTGFKGDSSDNATFYGGGVATEAPAAKNEAAASMDSQAIYSLNAAQTDGYLEDDAPAAKEYAPKEYAATQRDYETTDVITVFEGEDENEDTKKSADPEEGTGTGTVDGISEGSSDVEEHTTVIAQGGNGFTMDDLPEGSVYIMEFSENEEPEKYEAIREIAEDIKANNFRTAHPAEDPLLVITNNAADGSCEVYGFGNSVFTEVLYPDEDRLISAETNYSVPEISTYIEDIINEYGEE